LCAPARARVAPPSSREEIIVKTLRSVIVAAALLATGAATAEAQTMIEVTGRIGYTSADLNDWLGRGVFDPNPLEYGANGLVFFGRRGAGGLMIGGELGYGRLISYSFVREGVTSQDAVNALRLLVLTRFWFNEGAWFGEAGAGVVRLSDSGGAVNDPIISAGVGTLFDLTDQLEIVTKVRGSIIFDSGAPVLTTGFEAGLSYSLDR
jgi:hypothetical protein